MANLGSDDTPVSGESFSLPAGAQLDEDSGDFVIRDSGGTIILRRNETAGEWQFEGTDLAGIGSLDATSASVANAPTSDTDVARRTDLVEAREVLSYADPSALPESGTAGPAIAYVESTDTYVKLNKE